eukprot:6458613-Amphidinium_carterae.1
MASTGGDKAALEHVGFLPDFKSKSLPDHVMAAMVEDQDNLMKVYWRLTYSVMKCRASSMIRHTNGFPQCLAGLLHEDPEKVLQSMAMLRSMAEAYEEAVEMSDGKISALVKRCPMNLSVMRLATKLARAGGWKVVTPQLRDLLRALFHALGQTKLIEDSLKNLREKETRFSNNKGLCHFTEWHSTTAAGLLTQYHRHEVDGTSNAAVDANFNSDTLFQPVHGSDGSKDSVDL